MSSIILQSIGGLGLFLLGMIIMTQGLRELAGAAMRSYLIRVTRSPASGVLAGTAATALLQSSSATTVAAVGFVAAGLMPFTNALGIVFGSNIGTTVTGWLVVLIGFKFQLGEMLLLVIFFGAALKLFAKKRLAQVGFALAGFGLIFVGINMMQHGMSGLQGIITPDSFPPDTLWGRLLLVLLGAAITVVTQSSSAGVATTLSALHVGTVNFNQAAALVIGMDIGTTVTAVLATIGAGTDARRTAYSHVFYNLITATGAFFFLPAYGIAIASLGSGVLPANQGLALVGFHSLYNILGVLLILPFTYKFAGLLRRLVVDLVPPNTLGLDSVLLNQPVLALKAVHTSFVREFLAMLGHAHAILMGQREGRLDLRRMQAELDETRAYTDQIHLPEKKPEAWPALLAILHGLDHLGRFYERCEEQEDRAITARKTELLDHYHDMLSDALIQVSGHLEQGQWQQAFVVASDVRKVVHSNMPAVRQEIVNAIARGEISMVVGTTQLEAVRWLDRVARHISTITQYLREYSLAVAR